MLERGLSRINIYSNLIVSIFLFCRLASYSWNYMKRKLSAELRLFLTLLSACHAFRVEKELKRWMSKSIDSVCRGLQVEATVVKPSALWNNKQKIRLFLHKAVLPFSARPFPATSHPHDDGHQMVKKDVALRALLHLSFNDHEIRVVRIQCCG